jgi:hypothetical protein
VAIRKAAELKLGENHASVGIAHIETLVLELKGKLALWQVDADRPRG